MTRRLAWTVLTLLLVGLVAIPLCLGSDATPAKEHAEGAAAEEQAATAAVDWAKAFQYLAAALAISLPAIGTGWAQSRIGAAGSATIAERPETAGSIIVLLALPETLVILGFVVAVLIVFA